MRGRELGREFNAGPRAVILYRCGSHQCPRPMMVGEMCLNEALQDLCPFEDQTPQSHGVVLARNLSSSKVPHCCLLFIFGSLKLVL